MTLPRLGEMPSYAKVEAGSKVYKGNPSPDFGDKSAEIPENFKWINGAMEDFFSRLRQTTLKTSQPYWQYPPFDHEDIDIKFKSAAIAAAGTATLATITVPQHQVAVITLYGQDVEAVVAPTLASSWDNIEWTFKVGKFPLRYYDAFVGQRGNMINMRPTAITIMGPETFTVTVENTAAALAYYATISICGFQYSVLNSPIPRDVSMNL